MYIYIYIYIYTHAICIYTYVHIYIYIHIYMSPGGDERALRGWRNAVGTLIPPTSNKSRINEEIRKIKRAKT